MAAWASYLGLGKKAQEVSQTAISIEVAEKSSISPVEASSTYGGKAAEDALVKRIIEAPEPDAPTFVKSSKRTQSDTPIVQVIRDVAPRRAQSNASRVANMFGYGSARQQEPNAASKSAVVVEKPISEAATIATVEARTKQALQVRDEKDSKDGRAMASEASGESQMPTNLFGTIDKVVNSIVDEEDENVGLEDDRAMLQYEKISEQIRLERDEMEAERERMVQAQEKMKQELERMAQEEEEILEYYKIMGIEEPRPRKFVSRTISMVQPATRKVQEAVQLRPSIPVEERTLEKEIASPNGLDEKERIIEQRREKQNELDREVELQQARKLPEADLESLLSYEAGDFLDSISLKERDLAGSPSPESIQSESESEYEDEFIDDEDDEYGTMNPFQQPKKAELARSSGNFQDTFGAEQTRTKKEYEADILRYRPIMGEADFATSEKSGHGRRSDVAERLVPADILREAESIETKRLERLETEMIKVQRLEVEEQKRIDMLKQKMEEDLRRQVSEREAQEREDKLRREKSQREAQEQETLRRQESEREAQEQEILRQQESEREGREREEILLRREREREAREKDDRFRTRDLEGDQEEEEENLRGQELQRAVQQQEALREFESREILQREKPRMGPARTAEQKRLEIDRRLSNQEKQDAEYQVAKELQAARSRAEEEAAQAAFEKAEGIRKAAEKMRLAYAAMAAEKGGEPVVVPTLEVPGFPPAGRRSLIDTDGQLSSLSKTEPQQQLGTSQSILRPRPSIRGGLPSGPKGNTGLLPQRRKPSVDQSIPSRSAAGAIPTQIPVNDAIQQNKDLPRPRPSIKGGLPSGPRAGIRPPQRNLSMKQNSGTGGGRSAPI